MVEWVASSFVLLDCATLKAQFVLVIWERERERERERKLEETTAIQIGKKLIKEIIFWKLFRNANLFHESIKYSSLVTFRSDTRMRRSLRDSRIELSTRLGFKYERSHWAATRRKRVLTLFDAYHSSLVSRVQRGRLKRGKGKGNTQRMRKARGYIANYSSMQQIVYRHDTSFTATLVYRTSAYKDDTVDIARLSSSKLTRQDETQIRI